MKAEILTNTLKNYVGAPVMSGAGEGAEPVTLGHAILQALIATLPGDEKMASGDKLKIALLIRRVHGLIEGNQEAGGDDCFSAEETKLIKDRTAKAYVPDVMLSIWELIDPAGVK